MRLPSAVLARRPGARPIFWPETNRERQTKYALLRGRKEPPAAGALEKTKVWSADAGTGPFMLKGWLTLVQLDCPC